MATSVWKGYLTFGLISIPIRLFSAARTERISLNQLHNVCKTRIRMPLFCPHCERQVPRNEIVKGYEYEKDQYVLFNEDELDKIEPQSARSMEILEFVKVDEIDPLYLRRFLLRHARRRRQESLPAPARQPWKSPATPPSPSSPCTSANTSWSFARAPRA